MNASKTTNPLVETEMTAAPPQVVQAVADVFRRYDYNDSGSMVLPPRPLSPNSPSRMQLQNEKGELMQLVTNVLFKLNTSMDMQKVRASRGATSAHLLLHAHDNQQYLSPASAQSHSQQHTAHPE